MTDADRQARANGYRACRWCGTWVTAEHGAWVDIETGDHHCGEGEHEVA